MVYRNERTETQIDFLDTLITDTHYLDHEWEDAEAYNKLVKKIEAIFSSPDSLSQYLHALTDQNIRGIAFRFHPLCSEMLSTFELIYSRIITLRDAGLSVSQRVIDYLNPENPQAVQYHESQHALVDADQRDIEDSYIEFTLNFNEAGELSMDFAHYLQKGDTFRPWRDSIEVTLAPEIPSKDDFDDALDRIHTQIMGLAAEYAGLLYMIKFEEPDTGYLRSLLNWNQHRLTEGSQTESVLQAFIDRKGLTIEECDEAIFMDENMAADLKYSLAQEMRDLIAAARKINESAKGFGFDYDSKVEYMIECAMVS